MIPPLLANFNVKSERLMVQENVDVQQVKQNTDMDSHEDKLHVAIIKSKVEDTKAVMKAKAQATRASKLKRLEVSIAFGHFAIL